MEDLSFQVLLDKIKPTAEGKLVFPPEKICESERYGVGMVAPAVKREVVAMLRQQVDRQCE